MNTTDRFINAYKNLETTLRNADPEAFEAMKDRLDAERFLCGDFSVLSFENALTDAEMQQKVKLVRITRNYIQHHDDGGTFAAVSEEEVDFINELTEEIEAGQKSAGDSAVKIPLIKHTDDNKTAAKVMSRAASQARGMDFAVPVISGGASVPYVVGWLDIDAFLSLISAGKTVSGMPIKKAAKPGYIEFIDAGEPASDLLPDKEYIVTGKKQTIKGIIFKKK